MDGRSEIIERDLHRGREISRVTWVGLWVNVFLTAFKITAGFAGNSRAVVADVAPDHPSSLARVAYEVGNTHAALFFGESDFQLVTPYSEPLLTALGAIHGVTAHAEDVTFDLGRSLSTTAHHHHH